MNTSNHSPRSSVALPFVLTFGLSACAACGPGNMPGEYQDPDGGTPATQKPVAPRTQDGGMLPCEQNGDCDNYPTGPGGTGGTGSGSVSVTFVNSLPVQATFYASGGGSSAFTTYYQTLWIPAGGATALTKAMSGPIGATLSMSTRLQAESFPGYVHDCVVTLVDDAAQCVIRAERNADGLAVLSCECAA